MTSKKKIAADLQSVLTGQSPMSLDLYVEVRASRVFWQQMNALDGLVSKETENG
jgi:hypothetical protein